MEQILNILYLGLIIGIGLIFCKTISNYRILCKNNLRVQVDMCLANCESDVIEECDFLLLKNSGANPCDDIGDIEYVDYIDKDDNIFWERVN